MNTVATFKKIPLEEYERTIYEMASRDEPWFTPEALYEDLKLPVRSTAGSAGYDFYMPFTKTFHVGYEYVIPTGIRVRIDDGWMLACLPRSGVGFKYGLRLKNTMGIIDSDYYYADNFGHIMAKITVDTTLKLSRGDRFMQGIFLPYGITTDDKATAVRTGGFGSTGEK